MCSARGSAATVSSTPCAPCPEAGGGSELVARAQPPAQLLAPAAGLRSFVVPRVEEAGIGGCRHAPGEEVAVEAEASCRLLPRRVAPPRRGSGGGTAGGGTRGRELQKRVLLIDGLVCPRCSGARKVLAAIHDPDSIRRVLGALGLDSEVPELLPARGPGVGGVVGRVSREQNVGVKG